MTSIGIIGAGNVGLQLAKAFSLTGIYEVEFYSRKPDSFIQISELINVHRINQVQDFKSEMIFVCVPDHAVQTVIDQIPLSKCAIVTAGSIDLIHFKRPFTGTFYPMQTFSANIQLSTHDYPIFIEGSTEEITKELEKLAQSIGKKSHRSTHETRIHYHLTAVWVNNFMNHVLFLAKELSDANKLDWNLFFPLIDETISKMKTVGPEAAQTGPAKRNDKETIDRHMLMLNGLQHEIYALMTQSIKNTYNSIEDGKL